jgi:peptidoglycan/LPS O-acetylase OafA/YrhL
LAAGRNEREFFPYLEATRGVAALMVALFHIGLTPYVDAVGAQRRLVHGEFFWGAKAFRILANGPGAVIFFFILSGFVLTKVLQAGPAVEMQNARQFVIGRIFRIYPAVLATLGVFYLIFLAAGYGVAAGEFSPLNIVLNALLIRPTIDSVMWSLQLEMLAAPMLLLIFMAWRRLGFRAIGVPYVLLLVLSFTAVWNHLIGPPFSLGQIYAFIAGMSAFLYGREIVVRLRRPGVWLAAAIIAFAITRPIVGWSSYWTIWLETIFGSSIVALLAFGAFRTTGSRAIAIARFFGRISFSVYLLHPLTLLAQPYLSAPIAVIVDAGVHPLLITLALFFASVAITTPLAWLQYRFIERPFIAIGFHLQKAPLERSSPQPAEV